MGQENQGIALPSEPTSNGDVVRNRSLNEKIRRELEGLVILKPLTRWNEAYKEFPRFVLEYLVARYVSPEEPVDGQRKIDRILSEHYTESSKKELIKSAIREKGQYTLLGQLTVRLEASRDHYWADVPALGESTVRVSQRVLKEYGDVLLTSGAWGTMGVEYDATYEIKGASIPSTSRSSRRFRLRGSTLTITSSVGVASPTRSGWIFWSRASGSTPCISIGARSG